mgnify:CR=1 FL=1
MKKIKLIENDYYQRNINNFEKLLFLKKISKSDVYITPTGLICHKVNSNTDNSLKLWENKIYSKKINSKLLHYSAYNPVMLARHYYSAIFLKKNLNKLNHLCDFGTGEGTFLIEFLRVFPKSKISFTEHSKKNFHKLKKIFKNRPNFVDGINGSIENSNLSSKVDVATLNWTLCNCVNPLKVLAKIHTNLQNNGKILISESSRIMVPFKKPIHNFFNKKLKTENTHPWFFSFKSLSNLLEVSGFRVINFNRFYDENDLVVLAEKRNKKNHKPIIKFEKKEDIKKFMIAWKNFSKKFTIDDK